jgi:hypothetical protein
MMSRPNATLDLVRLRLAAALTHQLPALALTLWASDGAAIVVSRDAANHPDLSACELRAVVAATRRGLRPPPVLRQALECATDLSVEGIGVRHVGDGVVAAERGVPEGGRGAAGRWWPTLLGPDEVTAVLAEAAVAVLESDLVPARLVATAEVSAHVDPELGVTVVELRSQSDNVADERRSDELARALARACVVAELLATVDGTWQHEAGRARPS